MLFFFSGHGQQPKDLKQIFLCIATCGGTETFLAFVLGSYKYVNKTNGGQQTSVTNEKRLKVHNPRHFILYFSSQWLLATLRQFLPHARLNTSYY